MDEALKKPALKRFCVALDRPGSGWNCIIKARSKDGAIRTAVRKFREVPDTAYEVTSDFEKAQSENREQEVYTRLDEGSFLIALELVGVLPKTGENFPNVRMLKAMRDKQEVSRIKELLNRQRVPLA